MPRPRSLREMTADAVEHETVRNNRSFLTRREGARAGQRSRRCRCPDPAAARRAAAARGPAAGRARPTAGGAVVITSVNCPMSPRAPDGSMSNGTSQQVPADAARLKGRPRNARLRPGWRVRSACGGTSFCALYRIAHGVGRPKAMRSGSSGFSEAAAATARAVAAARAVVKRKPPGREGTGGTPARPGAAMRGTSACAGTVPDRRGARRFAARTAAYCTPKC